MLGIGERDADADLLDPIDENDVAGLRFLGQHALQSLEYPHLVRLRVHRRPVSVEHGDDLAGTDAAAVYASDADAADVARIIERADLQLKRTVRVVGANRHVLEYRFEERTHVVALLLEARGRPSLERRGVDDRKIELFFSGAQLVEEIERVIHHPVRARTGPVHLVDDDDGFQSLRERLPGDEARLGHRAVDGVDQQQHAVYHRQHALDLPAEIGVAWRIDDVDMGALVADGTVLREDGDAALALEVVRVHHPLDHVLVRGEGAGLAQQLVDQGRLAVVDVGDDGDVADRAHGVGVARKAREYTTDALRFAEKARYFFGLTVKCGRPASSRLRAQHYFRASRQSITARTPAITSPNTLAHAGIAVPCTVTSQPRSSRNACTIATTAKTTAAMVVNGFMCRRWYALRFSGFPSAGR